MAVERLSAASRFHLSLWFGLKARWDREEREKRRSEWPWRGLSEVQVAAGLVFFRLLRSMLCGGNSGFPLSAYQFAQYRSDLLGREPCYMELNTLQDISVYVHDCFEHVYGKVIVTSRPAASERVYVESLQFLRLPWLPWRAEFLIEIAAQLRVLLGTSAA